MSFFAWPYPAPSTDPVVSVGVQGDRFVINGKIQHIRGFTDFAGFNIYRNTGQLSPLALQMQQIHHDFVSLSVPALTPRILLMKNGGSLFDLDPRTIPDFFNKLDAHATAMTANQFVPLYTLLADCRASGMNYGYQLGFVRDACAVLRNHPCLVSLVNEYNNNPQQVDPMAFDKPDGVCISRGSPTPDGQIPWPAWDWLEIHSRRDAKWLQTISDSSYSFRAGDWGNNPGGHEVVSIPIMDSEPNKAGVNYTDTRSSFMLGTESAMWYGTAVLHMLAGTTSDLLPQDQKNQAITFLRGMFAVPETP